MRAVEIIRAILDILDKEEQGPTLTIKPEEGEPVASRFKQILSMLDNPPDSPIANAPNEVVAPVSSVTTDAGGGVNGPKHHHDIRIKDPSMYSDKQEY
jgi:mannitol-1-phosphate/altronate dehydrogenase